MRRVLGLGLGSAMIMAMAPGVASAQTQPDAIDTSVICGDVESNFDDIAGSTHEYNVRCMADFGLTEGLAPDGTSYGPRLDVTRGQMASFIARFIEDYNEQALPPGNPARFDDVPPTDSQYVHATNIHKLAAINVVEGTNASDGQSYAPNANVTRGQMASFIRRALSYLDNGSVNPLSEPPAGPDAFPDDDGSIHEPNINALAGVRIVEGFTDGDYRPLALVKRDQMASFVMRAYAWAETENLGDDPTDPTDPDPDPEPEGPTIEESFVAVAADSPSVATGDIWELTFSDAVDTFVVGDTGATFTVEGADDVELTVQCVLDAEGDLDDVGDDNVAAICELDEDGLSMTIELVGDPGDAGDYPLTLTDTTLEAEDDDRAFDLDPEFSDVLIEITEDTEEPNGGLLPLP